MSDIDLLAPKSSEKSIQDHLRYYYSLIRSGQKFLISSLFNTYRLSRPSLHKLMESNSLDISALSYSVPRLPPSIFITKNIVIAQSPDQLKTAGIDVLSWELQGAQARRRQNFFDHVTQTMAVLINSDSDLDDFINCLIATQIERQKFITLNQTVFGQLINQGNYSATTLTENDFTRLKTIFGPTWPEKLTQFHKNLDPEIVALPQNEQAISDSVATWWQKLSTSSLIFDFESTPLYFISSNLHSLTNLIGGYVNDRQDYILAHTDKNYHDLYAKWLEFKGGGNSLRVIDFLYYISSKYFRDLPDEQKKKDAYEENLGIKKLKINSQLPCEAQLIPLKAIATSPFRDPNLKISEKSLLGSNAYILNIEYPLGFSAYYILSEMLTRLSKLKGVYIIGKAAILTGDIGDIQVPKVIFDERTNNILHPRNIFNEYFPFPSFQSSVLQNQKAISVYGTFLENESQLQNYIESGFNIIEMESGPYLTAILKHQQDWNTIPHDQVANIKDLPFDLGIINYASDNPLSKTLGEGTMSIKGVEPTYLAALTSLQRIIDLESV